MGAVRVRAVLVAALSPLAAAACVSHAAAPAERSSPVASTPGAADVDSTLFARTLVVQCARVREGDMVLVSGAPKDARFLEDVATEVRRVGAHPLVWLESDRLKRRSIIEVPEEFDEQAPAWRMRLADIVDAEIVIDGSEDESLLADVSPRRIAAMERAALPVTRTLMDRGVRQVYVGNDLRPTADRAKRFGMTEAALGRAYRAALDVDYAALEATGRKLSGAVGSATELHLTAANGTDLRFGVGGRRAYVSDGVISADDVAKGGAALMTWLPAGEAFVSAVPGTAEGKIVVDRDTWDGAEYRNLVLTFHQGRLVSMTGESGTDRLTAAYAAGGAGKDVFGGVDIGFNPALATPAGTSMRSYAVSGNVTVAFGASTWLGGDDACDFGFTASLAGATLEADGRAIVKSGAIVR
jgi:leucyl aminopeptidase (aminopeptidase T)